MFPGRVSPIAAAGFVGLMSLFNMGGRFFWASTSDFIGRKNTYFVFMVLGFALYCLVPYMGAAGSVEGFVLCFLVIISMYGGGFSTVPAYLKDMSMSAPSMDCCPPLGQWPASSGRCW